MAKKAERCWCIWNERIGFYLTALSDRRRLAIKEHENAVCRSWAECRKNGDKAVRAILTKFNGE